MKILRLKLSGFRNIESMTVTPSDGVNIIYGGNAQGKTNMLEAIWLFTGAKSFRGARDSELPFFSRESSVIEMDFLAQGREQNARVVISQGRTATLNGVALGSASALAGSLCAVVFSPDDLYLIKDGPARRRYFLDAAIGQLFPGHNAHMSVLRRVLAQRGALLRDIRVHDVPSELLEVWDERLAKAASHIVHARFRYVSRLSLAASDIYSGISKNSERLSLSYVSGIPGAAAESSAPEIYALCLKALGESRGADIASGNTGIGPHRDELDIRIEGISARSFGSQGQQRSCALALKLAECGIISNITGEQPVILLDDVMSELDEDRRDYLLNHITGGQVFITCCDTSCFTGISSAKAFHINAGSVAGERGI